jgi:hypothetical protein
MKRPETELALSVVREMWLRKHGESPVIVEFEGADDPEFNQRNGTAAARKKTLEALGIEPVHIVVRFVESREGEPCQ